MITETSYNANNRKTTITDKKGKNNYKVIRKKNIHKKKRRHKGYENSDLVHINDDIYGCEYECERRERGEDNTYVI